MIQVTDTETCVLTSFTVQGFETRVAICFKPGIATNGFEAGVASRRFETSVATCFETDVPDQCLLAAVTTHDIPTADAAFTVTFLHDD